MLLVWALRTLFWIATIENTSMAPTLLPGDRVLVGRSHPMWRLQKGQIVIVAPGAPGSTPFVKRVSGLAGDVMHWSGSDDISDTFAVDTEDIGQEQWHVCRIPEDHVFVSSDNPASRIDSRTWGPLSYHQVIGRVLMTLPRTTAIPSHPVRAAARVVGPPVGQPAPPFIAPILDGELRTLEMYRGRAVLFLFIAPSERAHQFLTQFTHWPMAANHRSRDVVLVSRLDQATTQAFVTVARLKLPVLIAPPATNPFFKNYNIRGCPAYCLVDVQGIVQAAGIPDANSSAWQHVTESWL